MKLVQEKETCWHITWYENPIGWEDMNLRVRLISNEIILHSHLSRNPLDSIIKSYCKTTHIEAAITTHLFDTGMHCSICFKKFESASTWFIQRFRPSSYSIFKHASSMGVLLTPLIWQRCEDHELHHYQCKQQFELAVFLDVKLIILGKSTWTSARWTKSRSSWL